MIGVTNHYLNDKGFAVLGVVPFFAFQRNYWALTLAVKLADLVTGCLSKYILKISPFTAISSTNLYIYNKLCDLTYKTKVNRKQIKTLISHIVHTIKENPSKGSRTQQKGC